MVNALVRELRFGYRSLIRPSVVRVAGVKIQVDPNDAPRIRATWYRDRYEYSERQILTQTLERSDRYVELGGGVGFLTALAAKKIGDPGRVTVFEANPELIHRIRAVLASNGLAANVEHAILGHGHGEATFYVHREFWLSSITHFDDAVRTVSVPQKDFRSTVEALGATYLMVDIEGGEASLFVNGVPDCVRKICIELHPSVLGLEGVTEVLALLMQQGFLVDLDRSQGAVVFLRRAAAMPRAI
jgi:FkbM family methyltransferase